MTDQFDMESPRLSVPALLPSSLLLQTSSVPLFNDSDTAPRGSAILQNRANPQVVREAQDNFRTAMREAQDPKQGRPTCRVWGDKDDDPALRDWQWSAATWTGSPEGEHSSAHQYGVPPRGNANFAWVQHFIHHLTPLFLWNDRMPQGSLKRGDRQRAARAQAITSAAVGDAIA